MSSEKGSSFDGVCEGIWVAVGFFVVAAVCDFHGWALGRDLLGWTPWIVSLLAGATYTAGYTMGRRSRKGK
jgi:hypothetical protein